MILQEGPVIGHGVICGNRAEGLTELIGPACRKILQVGEDVQSSESVGGGYVFMHVVNGGTRFPEMMPDTARIGVVDLVVHLTTVTVTFIRAAEIHETSDFDSRPGGIIRAQHGAPVRDLKTQVADRPRIENRGQRTDNCLVTDKAAAASAGDGPTSGIVSIPNLAIIGEGVPQHQRIAAVQLMVDFGGCFGLGPRDREKTIANPLCSQSRERATVEDSISHGSQRWTDE